MSDKVGPFAVNGHLFYRVLHGSVITCECMGEPYVSAVVAAHGAEIARLRAVLQEIADAEPSYDYDAAVLLSNLARIALKT